MLKYVSCYPRSGARLQRGARLRILGDTGGRGVIYMVNTQKTTSIEIVQPDGSSITALLFNEYMDIINADLSPDNELIHITNRVSSNKGFAFSSIICHIHSTARSKEFISEQPIIAFFLNDNNPPSYQLIHIVGDKMAHIQATLSKKQVDIERLRGGINIPSVIHWSYHRDLSTLYVIHEINNQYQLSEFNIKNIKSSGHSPFTVSINSQSKLPDELSLNPLATMHIPFFRTFKNRIFVTRYHSKVCIIQQLFDNPDGCLMFSVNTYPRPFFNIVTVPNAPCDLPLCFLQFSSVIVAFVPNHFVCFVDISQTPPFMSLQMKPFCTSPCGDCSSPIQIANCIIDLNSCDIYQISIDLSQAGVFAKSMDKSKWDLMALIAARLENVDSYVGIFDLLQRMGDVNNVFHFFRRLFKFIGFETMPRSMSGHLLPKRQQSMVLSRPQSLVHHQRFVSESSKAPHFNALPDSILSRLTEIDTEFPSASSVTRKHAFRNIIKSMMQRNTSLKFEKAAQKAMSKLESQNSLSLLLRASIDKWCSSIKPDIFWEFIICFVMENESIFSDFPSIMVLRDEVENLFASFGTESMRRVLEHSKVINPRQRHDSKDEMEFWLNRIDLPVANDETTSSASSKSMKYLVNRRNNSSSNELSETGSSFYWGEKADFSERTKF